MTTQGEHAPSPAERPAERPVGQTSERPVGAYRARRVTARRVVGWVVVIGVVAAGGWVITSPTPGDFIPGLGPSSKDATKSPPVVGDAPRAVADPEALDVDAYFPAQRLIEAGGYKGKRSGARRGDNCTEVLQDRTLDLLRDGGCRGYLAVSFAGQEKPVLSSVTLLRFADAASAARAAEALRARPGSVAFVLPDASAAPAQAAGTARPGGDPRVELVGHYVTVTSSRPVDAHPASPTPSASAGTPLPVPSTGSPSVEQMLDEATRALSATAGAPFVWM
ncbi:hypothetical protein PUR61_37650 [Streptomyces sp. BE20]|uniref:hypothetical protein n=1 Tax=Streptomyces sp. BE20 TaxID=3002525 RepID=UPI002E75B06E|nr:hypothetical protein [Streptomyces sp. BE20]MEE1827860.1 hypothetical protein [Streptomyces sp. BE20]